MDHGSTTKIRHQDVWAQLIELPSIRLTIVSGPDAPSTVDMQVSLLRVGADPASDMVLTDPAVSRHHLEIARTEEGLLIRDAGSTNGTLLDGVRIKEALIQPRSRITVGRTVIEVDSYSSRRMAIPEALETFEGLVGKSSALREVYAVIQAVAGSAVTVLLEGESGTGKEVVARAIHQASHRTGEFCAVDCGSLSPDLVQSELFGHKGGSFTGAGDDRTGACRAASRGTLFIDEIGELPLAQQATFLRFLELREVKPLGVDRPIPVDVRVVAATNVDLADAVARKQFRLDLYHRLKVIRLRLPPLRERLDDLPLLVDHFASRLGAKVELTPDSWAAMRAYAWPGNVRELMHMVERISLMCRGRPATVVDLDLETESREASAAAVLSIEDILATIASCGGNKSLAAKKLGISRSTLFRRLKEAGIGDTEE